MKIKQSKLEKNILFIVLSSLFLTCLAFSQPKILSGNQKKDTRVAAESNPAEVKFGNIQENSISLTFTTPKQSKIIIIRKENKKEVAPGVDKKYTAIKNIAEATANSITGDSNYVIYIGSEASKEISVGGLLPDTKYCIDLYELKSGETPEPTTFHCTTLAAEPKKQCSRIMASIIKDKDILFFISKGDGKKRIVLIRENGIPSDPADGKEYKADTVFGKGDMLKDSTFVVLNDFNKKNNTAFRVQGLKPGTDYYVRVCEANGDKESTNYLLEKIEKKNPFKRATIPEPPVALNPTDVKSNSFQAHWKKVKGGSTYLLDIGYDEDFQKIVDDYKELDVGDLDSILIEELPKASDTFYLRIRAVGSSGPSENSNIIEIKMK
jgi:hypothetical protein